MAQRAAAAGWVLIALVPVVGAVVGWVLAPWRLGSDTAIAYVPAITVATVLAVVAWPVAVHAARTVRSPGGAIRLRPDQLEVWDDVIFTEPLVIRREAILEIHLRTLHGRARPADADHAPILSGFPEEPDCCVRLMAPITVGQARHFSAGVRNTIFRLMRQPPQADEPITAFWLRADTTSDVHTIQRWLDPSLRREIPPD